MLTIPRFEFWLIVSNLIVGTILYHAFHTGDWMRCAAMISALLFPLILVRLCSTKS